MFVFIFPSRDVMPWHRSHLTLLTGKPWPAVAEGSARTKWRGDSGRCIMLPSRFSLAHEGHVLLFSLLGNVKASWEVGLELPPEFSDRVTITVWQVPAQEGVWQTQLFS